jgi:hypothetical protein
MEARQKNGCEGSCILRDFGLLLVREMTIVMTACSVWDLHACRMCVLGAMDDVSVSFVYVEHVDSSTTNS